MDNNSDHSRIDVRIRLAALWASVTLCYLYGDYFELYVPGKVEGLLNGSNLLDSPTKLFLASVLLVIPALMVFLSVTLNALINKWINILFGLFYTAVMILVGATSISAWRAFYVFLAGVEVCITGLVVWNALKWKPDGGPARSR